MKSKKLFNYLGQTGKVKRNPKFTRTHLGVGASPTLNLMVLPAATLPSGSLRFGAGERYGDEKREIPGSRNQKSSW